MGALVNGYFVMASCRRCDWMGVADPDERRLVAGEDRDSEPAPESENLRLARGDTMTVNFGTTLGLGSAAND